MSEARNEPDRFIDYDHPVVSLRSLGFESKRRRLTEGRVFRFLALAALFSALICGGLSAVLDRPAPEAGQRMSVQIKDKDPPGPAYVYGPVRPAPPVEQGRRFGRFDLQNAINGATLGLLIAGFWLGLRQREIEEKAKAFEAAFARKTRSNDQILGNKKLHKYTDAATSVDVRGAKVPFEEVMYGYLELDNLEFVYEHFRDALIKPKAALRAVSIFRSRCDNPEFAGLVGVLCEKGEYRPQFVDAVKFVMQARRVGRGSDGRNEG
jgi:hypothetical protein